MHSFPQFTRNTLWGRIHLSGGNYFRGNFMVRGQLSAINIPRGAIFLGSNYHRGQLSGGQLSGGQSPGRNYSGVNFLGVIVLEP